MWTREQLKANAKSSLSRFHWTAVLVCLIVVLLGGAGSSGLNFNLNLNDGSSWVRWAVPAMATIGTIGTLLGILVGNVAAVGSARFFLIGRERIPTTEIMFDPFRANYGGILGVLYVNPYVAATNAELYIALRTNAFAAGITGPEELPGV